MRVAILSEYPGYVISDDGRIQGSRGWWLKPSPDKDGYLKIQVRGVNFRVHRLVCLAFHGECSEGEEVRHLNGDPSDNRASNLAWGTRAENDADRVTHGTLYCGIRHHRAKLTPEAVRRIRTRYAAGGVSQRDLAREYGVAQPSIKKIVNYQAWRGAPR